MPSAGVRLGWVETNRVQAAVITGNSLSSNQANLRHLESTCGGFFQQFFKGTNSAWVFHIDWEAKRANKQVVKSGIKGLRNWGGRNDIRSGVQPSGFRRDYFPRIKRVQFHTEQDCSGQIVLLSDKEVHERNRASSWRVRVNLSLQRRIKHQAVQASVRSLQELPSPAHVLGGFHDRCAQGAHYQSPVLSELLQGAAWTRQALLHHWRSLLLSWVRYWLPRLQAGRSASASPHFRKT